MSENLFVLEAIKFMRLEIMRNAIKRVLSSFVILAACFGLVFSWSGVAQASTEAGAAVKARAERKVDSQAGAGTTNQIEGKAQEELGRAQRQFGDEAEGTTRQLRGKVQKNVGQAQESAEGAAKDAGGLVEKVKDFFD